MGNKNELRRATTLTLDRKAKECSQMVGDKHLLVQLAVVDMVAIDAVCHHTCHTRLYRKAETVGCDFTERNETQVIRVQVLNELLDFIEDCCGSGGSLAMADLTALHGKGFPYNRCNTTTIW